MRENRADQIQNLPVTNLTTNIFDGLAVIIHDRKGSGNEG